MTLESKSARLARRLREAVAKVMAEEQHGGDVQALVDAALTDLRGGLALPWHIGEQHETKVEIQDARHRVVARISAAHYFATDRDLTNAEARAHAEAIVRAVNALGER